MAAAERGMFGTDIYILEGLIRQLGRGHALRIVDPAAVCDAFDETVALLVLQHVSYRTGAVQDLAAVTAAAHAQCACVPKS